MQLAGQHKEVPSHSAVRVHPQHLQVLATVPIAFATRKTILAVDVRLNRTAIARLHIRHPCPNGDDLDPQLVSWNAGITVERHLAQVTAQVGTADSNPM